MAESDYPGLERRITIGAEERAKHLAIIGPTGSGKTALLTSLISQDMQRGWGVIVVALTGALIRQVVERVPPHRVRDVVLLDASDNADRVVGIDPLAGAATDPDRAVDDLVFLFRQLHATSWGPRLEDLRAALLTLTRRPGYGLLEVGRLFTDDTWRRQWLADIGDGPLVLAPTGFTRIADPQGELAVARAAARAGLPYTLSTLSTRSIEEVRSVSDGRLCFQVYAWRDRGLAAEIDRAGEAGTLRVAGPHSRHGGSREARTRHPTGVLPPPTIGLNTLLDGVVHPGWTWSFLRSKPIRFANVVGREAGDGASPVTLSDYINTQFDPAQSWDDVAWLRSIWDGPIIVKDIQTVDDAALAVEAGSTTSPCPTTAAGNSTTPPRRSNRSRRWPTRSAAKSRSFVTAASAAAATSSKPSPPARPPAWPAAPTCTGWARRANAVWTKCSAGATSTSKEP